MEVKKASTINSLEDLDLSTRAYKALAKFKGEKAKKGDEEQKQATPENTPVQNIILLARTGKLYVKSMREKYYIELNELLKNEGFIRQDIKDNISFGIETIMRLAEVSTKERPKSISEFETNEQYETYQPLTDEQIGDFKGRLRAILEHEEVLVIFYRYALYDGKFHDIQETANLICYTQEIVKHIEAKALRKIKSKAQNQALLKGIPGAITPILHTIDGINLSQQAYEVLMNAGLDTADKIIAAANSGALKELPNFSRKISAEVLEKLYYYQHKI